ncbi:MAG: hypothetical protein ACRC5A_09985, partial [Enterobacteriaceae bacterium]
TRQVRAYRDVFTAGLITGTASTCTQPKVEHLAPDKTRARRRNTLLLIPALAARTIWLHFRQY